MNTTSKSILKNIIDGMASVLVLYPENDYQRPDKLGFSQDAANLRADFNRVATDLRNTVLKHGENYYR